MPVWIAAAVVLVGNLLFGYWRANVKKLSVQWVLAIHIPVVLTIALRALAGIPLDPATFILMSSAFFLGQTAGQRARIVLASALPMPPTSCLPIDLVRAVLG